MIQFRVGAQPHKVYTNNSLSKWGITYHESNIFYYGGMMKLLVILVHFYSKSSKFLGKSRVQSPELRKYIVELCADNWKGMDCVDLKVVGIEGSNLIDLDIDATSEINDSRKLVYYSLKLLRKYLDQYDYFVVCEDDLLVQSKIVQNIIDFNSKHNVKDIFLPNRIEIAENALSFVDIEVDSMLLNQNMILFNGEVLRNYRNTHSGIAFFSKAQLEYAVSQLDMDYEGIIVGSYMASAFAHFHSPFNVFKVSPPSIFHSIVHLDPFVRPSIKQKIVNKFRSSFNEV